MINFIRSLRKEITTLELQYGQFSNQCDSKIVIYKRRAFINLATDTIARHRDVFLMEIFLTDILLMDTFSTGHIFDGTYF